MSEAANWEFFTPHIIDTGVYWYQLLGLAGLLYLLWRSQIRRQPRYLLPMLLGWLLVLLGALLRIMHWPVSTEMMLSGALLQWLPYALWVWQRRPVTLLKGLKLAWLTGSALTIISVALHLPGRRPLAAGNTALFWCVLLYGLYELHLRRPGYAQQVKREE
jgi:hypothetical protein